MRTTIATAAFAALAAGTLGVSAKDTVPNMAGSETLKDMTRDVLVECGANCANLVYLGGGSAVGEANLSSGTQSVAPMARPLNGTSGICEFGQPEKTEGIVFALDGVAVVAQQTNACNSAAQGLQFDPAVGNSWRDVSRLIYAGMPAAAGSNILLRDCNSAARRALVDNWNDIFSR